MKITCVEVREIGKNAPYTINVCSKCLNKNETIKEYERYVPLANCYMPSCRKCKYVCSIEEYIDNFIDGTTIIESTLIADQRTQIDYHLKNIYANEIEKCIAVIITALSYNKHGYSTYGLGNRSYYGILNNECNIRNEDLKNFFGNNVSGLNIAIAASMFSLYLEEYDNYKWQKLACQKAVSKNKDVLRLFESKSL